MGLDNSAEDDAPPSCGGLGVLSWTEELRRVAVAVSKNDRQTPVGRQQLFYLLQWTDDSRGFGIVVRKGRYPENGDELWSLDRALDRTQRFLSDDDRPILRLLWAERAVDTGLQAFGLGPQHGAEVLKLMAQSGRLYRHDDHSLLTLAEPRPATVTWRSEEEDGLQRPTLLAEPTASLIIPLPVPWYIDVDRQEIGPLAVVGNPAVVARLFALPPLSAVAAAQMDDALAQPLNAGVPVAPEAPHVILRSIVAAPQAVLRLQTLNTHGNRNWRDYLISYSGGPFDIAVPVFVYDDAEVAPDDLRDYAVLASGETVHIERQHEVETRLMDQLFSCDFEKIPGYVLHTFGRPPDNAYGLAELAKWPVFMRDDLLRLREAGWHVDFAADFRHRQLDIDAWDAELSEAENGWFNLDLGIFVEGERLPLAPLLAALFRRDHRWLDVGQLARIADDEIIDLITASGQRIRAAAERLKLLAATLIDLFDGLLGGTALRVSRFDAPRLAAFNDPGRWRFRGQHDILALAKRLSAAQGIARLDPPAGLGLELRHYQLEGLAWLQFLREQNIAGILADDMGLGKTAHTLAHLLLEKEAGRLDLPSLIVLPTSLIFNWKNEAARFAPMLTILSLHGPERKSHFAEIAHHDVVLTTYPLLWRDAAELMLHRYHLLILDEAQTVKNSRSQGAAVVRQIDARHRLCLTGTPLENHLGELWSQFDFLLPGFLGSNHAFTKFWRTPIEKQNDSERRELLARRVQPFILRRRKEEVARELPPKTVIIRKVELTGGQRDLYETVRVAMDEKVRAEIANKGFSRSQIVILDALLKLRQVCCDPRLVKAKAAQKVRERAKLELLMTMLPEQVEEGRRILLFSQFTSMLQLIEKELKAAGLDYLLLTGQSRDREDLVRRFQNAEVPIFLISLKTGGVGLNLTAADTVIHYDPWWNPAAENQATDRAHRLGQDKPVFVYKLIVAGSIEEKILTLQERKAELAAQILADDDTVDAKFTSEDLAALFSPLPE